MGIERPRQVGEVAKLLGISPSRIRLWENEGLLTVRRTASGHRVYYKADVERLREVKRLVDGEGWSAAAIKANLTAHFPDHVSHANAIGHRIRALRTTAGLSLRELAEQSGVSASTISSLERGLSMPSVGSLHKLGRAFGMTLATLLEAREVADSPVVRRNERVLLPMRTPGLAWERLYAGESVLESLMVTVQPGAGTDGGLQHFGEEFLYVIRGSIELVLDGEHRFDLNAGDAMTFDSMREHSYTNHGTTVAQIVWVNTPPTI
ncbi:MerR family transcriptional regulator [Mycolicibacterium sp. 22603]|uniref:MerR family transcriptional regulator n=1 Tax=Mycolicibacterium sp. 22603 TaxID=3453950 RepID=UPI003F835E9B